MPGSLEGRQDKFESVIQKLADISGDLSKMVAVHEQRLNQQEKDSDLLHTLVDKNKDDTEDNLKEVYDAMKEQEKNLFDEIAKFRQETSDQYKKLNEKIAQLEKYIWMAIGGGMTISWIVSNFDKLVGK